MGERISFGLPTQLRRQERTNELMSVGVVEGLKLFMLTLIGIIFHSHSLYASTMRILLFVVSTMGHIMCLISSYGQVCGQVCGRP